MGRPAKPTPQKHCQQCQKLMTRNRYGDCLEDLTSFMKRLYCDRACMAQAMNKEQCQSLSHSRMKAHRQVKSACEACGATGKLHVHHKDEDPSNNDPSNLRTLCPTCHRRSHSPNFMADGVTPKPCMHCANPSVKSRLCHTHLSRRQRFGDPLAKKIKTASGWILDASGLPVNSRRSPKASLRELVGSELTAMPSFPRLQQSSSKPAEVSIDR